jgi:hypothetical protein
LFIIAFVLDLDSDACANGRLLEEHAIAVDSARAIFLGYEIHPVFERRDEDDVAPGIVREKIVTVEAAKVILHRQQGAAEIEFVRACVR